MRVELNIAEAYRLASHAFKTTKDTDTRTLAAFLLCLVNSMFEARGEAPPACRCPECNAYQPLRPADEIETPSCECEAPGIAPSAMHRPGCPRRVEFDA